MARLNEPPIQNESLEALKRRFVRQNREIARANSAQSLKIRNLEAETSRLLAENIALRQEIIKLQADAEATIKHQDVVHNVSQIKTALEEKIKSLSLTVLELGKTTERTAPLKSPPKPSQPSLRSSGRSPDQRNWKNTLSLSEVTGAQEGRLPPIVEGKYYPRKTFEADDLFRLTAQPENTINNADGTPSPDLGSPPVARLEAVESLDGGAQNASDQSESVNGDDFATFLSSNLETRKRRRSSLNQLEIRRTRELDTGRRISQELDQSSLDRTREEATVKANRKLSFGNPPQDEESHVPLGKDEPVTQSSHSRERVVNDRPRSLTKSASLSSIKSDNDAARKERRGQRPTQKIPSRPALGPKDVNTDPVSSPQRPVRQGSKPSDVVPSKDDHSTGKRGFKQSTTTSKSAHSESRPLPERGLSREASRLQNKDAQSQKPQNASQSTIKAPKTPVASELFSPVSSEPSAAQGDSRDTPPPPELPRSTSTAEALQNGARPARRPRGQVNYAEPNLRDKMRRSTKELADAVSVEKSRASIVLVEESAKSGQSQDKPIRAMALKKEDAEDSTWKDLPAASQVQIQRGDATSPLHDKSTIRNVKSEDGFNSDDLDIRPGESARSRFTGRTSSNRTEGRKRPRVSSNTEPEDVQDLADTMRKLDVYDFRYSSEDESDETKGDRLMRHLQGNIDSRPRVSRRHSASLARSRSSTEIGDQKEGLGKGKDLGRRRMSTTSIRKGRDAPAAVTEGTSR